MSNVVTSVPPTQPVGVQVSYGWFVYTAIKLVNFWWYGNPGYRYDVWQTTDFVNWTRIGYLQANYPKEYMAIGIPTDQGGKFLTVMEVPA